MSLINDALKKAQRQRHEEQASDAPSTSAGGGAHIAKRGQARSANTIVLIGGGALALVLVSVAVTIFLVKRPHPVKPAATAETTSAAKPATPPPAAPAPVAETSAAPTPAAKSGSGAPGAMSISDAKAKPMPPTIVMHPAAPAAGPSTSTEPGSALPAVADKPAAAPTEAPEASITAPPKPDAKFDERVAAFVEAVRVTGIRSSDNDSRVLMNERIYRVNDIVERTLGVRLIKVAVDSLTFADANGVTYVKYF